MLIGKIFKVKLQQIKKYCKVITFILIMAFQSPFKLHI